MLGSGDGAHPGWTTDFYSSHQVVTFTYTSLQMASLLPAPRSSPGHCTQVAHPIPTPRPPSLWDKTTAYPSPAFFLQEAFLLQEALPQPGKGLAWFGRGLGKGAPPHLCGRLGVSLQIQGILWWRGWKVGRRQKSRGGKSGQRGVSCGGTTKEGCQSGGLLTPTERALSHPKNHNGQKKGWHMQQALHGAC